MQIQTALEPSNQPDLTQLHNATYLMDSFENLISQLEAPTGVRFSLYLASNYCFWHLQQPLFCSAVVASMPFCAMAATSMSCVAFLRLPGCTHSPLLMLLCRPDAV